MDQPVRRLLVIFFVFVPATWARAGRTLSVDAREALLGDVVKLMVAQGAPRVAVHEDLAHRKVTFAAKGISPAAGLRWLCRVEKLVVARDGGRLVLMPPARVPVVTKVYKIAKLAPTHEAARALDTFIQSTVFQLYPHRGRDADGKPAPRLEVECVPGKLRLVAPMMVHREVVALLNATLAVRSGRGYKQVAARYGATDIGFLAERGAPPAPRLQGEVELEGGQYEARVAVWMLTRAAGMSFYLDPWDDSLGKAHVELAGGKRALRATAEDLAGSLGAALRWYDGAWVICRGDRAPLFGDYRLRAYNVSGTNPFLRPLLGFARRQGEQRRRSTVPSAVERMSEDLWLVGGPSALHEALEGFVERGRGGPSFRRPGRGWR